MERTHVFQIGMVCAGSTSLCEALNILGIPSLHWEGPGPDYEKFETDVIPENIKSNRRLFYPYDEQFTGFLDFNGQLYYKTLYQMYPKSKFIFTWRANLPWVESSLRLNQNRWRNGEPVYIGAGDHRVSMVNTNIGQDMPEKELALKMKDMQDYWILHNQKIPVFFKNNPRFLEMRICDGDNDGWEKLCNFLEMDIPDVDFPKLKSNNIIFPQSQQITATYEG
jgi:hypothetical protein